MKEFNRAMLDLIKYQQEQQLILQKQQMENHRTMEKLLIEIQRKNLS